MRRRPRRPLSTDLPLPLLVALALTGLACRHESPPSATPPVPPEEETATAPEGPGVAEREESLPDGGTETPDASIGDASPDGARGMPAPSPDGYGDRCRDDAGCSWNDPCRPERCVGADRVDPAIACAESQPPPGTCRCVESACTLQPSTPPPPPDAQCEHTTCGLDVAGGRCLVGEAIRANRRILHVEGPLCECDDEARRCLFRWIEPVQCARPRDCWLGLGPRPHPRTRPSRRERRGDFWGRPCTGRSCEEGDHGVFCSSGYCHVTVYVH